jgi:hypothetical protein
MGGIGAPEGCGGPVHLITELDLTESNREISESKPTSEAQLPIIVRRATILPLPCLTCCYSG